MMPFSTSAVAEITLNTDAAGAQARSASSDGPRRGSAADCPTSRQHAAVGNRDDDGAAERDLEGAQQVLRRLLQARIQRQLGAAAVGEIGDVAMTGQTDRVGADERRGRGSGGAGARRFGGGGGQESGRCEEPDGETGGT